MRRLLCMILIAGLSLGLTGLGLAAEEKAKDEVKVQGQAVSGVQAVKESQRSSKFFEYRDVPRGVVFNALDLRVEKGDAFAIVRAEKIRQHDSRYELSVGQYGTYQIDLGYDRIPHRFSFFGRTPYNEGAPGILDLPDGLQLYLQDTVGGGSANSTAKMPLARKLLQGFLRGGVHDIDLGLQRDKYSLNFNVTPSVPLAFTVNASRETREGNRPLGTALGTSYAIELPAPIQYTTSEINASAEYSRRWGTLQAGYSLSIFENGVESLTWDNPYRLTDQYMSSGDNRTATGRLALPPSNSAQRFFFNGSARILKFTWVHATVSYGLMSQNEALLPYTTNTAIATAPSGYAGALTPPRASAGAKAHVTNLDFTLTSKIISQVYFTAGYRYYDFANKTELLDIPGSSPYDQSWSSGEDSNEPFSYSRSKLFADLTVNVLKNTSLKAGYSYSTINRLFASEDEAAEGEQDKDKEGAVKVSLDSNPWDWLEFRLSYLAAKRTWSLDSVEVVYIPGFNFKRYFEANRDRQGLNLLVGIDPIRNLNVQFSYMFGKDRYPHSDYGLKNSDFDTYGVDLSYALSPRASLNGFYSREIYKGTQESRQSGAVFSTNPGDDWSANLKDVVDSFGAGLTAVLKKDVLNLNLYSVYSRAKGSADLWSAPGGAVLTAPVVPFTAPLDETELLSLRGTLVWKMMAHFSIALGYWYERYKIIDIVANDASVDRIVPVAIPGGASAATSIFLGAIEPSYRYHVAYLNFICTW